MRISYGKSDENLKLWIELSRLNLVVGRNIFYPLRDQGLTPAQFAVLEALYHKGELSVGKIKESILTTSGNLTVVISNLEKRGLVVYKAGEDRRFKIIKITQQGTELVEKIFPLHLELIDKLLNLYSREEKAILTKLLRDGRKRIMEEVK